MRKITPFLWFNGQAEEAMNFYTSIFKNSKPGSVTRYGDAGPGPKGSVMTASFTLEGQEFIALNGGPAITSPSDGDALSLPFSVEWDTGGGFIKYIVQASSDQAFTKPVTLGASTTGPLIATSTTMSKLAALGNPFYLRVVGMTAEKYAAYGATISCSAQ